jgi:hypothetical protein
MHVSQESWNCSTRSTRTWWTWNLKPSNQLVETFIRNPTSRRDLLVLDGGICSTKTKTPTWRQDLNQNVERNERSTLLETWFIFLVSQRPPKQDRPNRQQRLGWVRLRRILRYEHRGLRDAFFSLFAVGKDGAILIRSSARIAGRVSLRTASF